MFLEQVQEIGLSELTNVILVNSGARNAFMLQYIDYNELSENNPISKGRIDSIRKYYPSLEMSPNSQGIIISLEKYHDIKDSKELGKILDYPCADSFPTPADIINNINYSYHLFAIYNINGGEFVAEIFSNASTLSDQIDAFKVLAEKYKKTLLENELIGPYIKDVIVQHSINISPKILLDVLKQGLQMEDYCIDAFANIMYNRGYSESFDVELFDFNNNYHRQIAIDIIKEFIMQVSGKKIKPITANCEELLIKTLMV